MAAYATQHSSFEEPSTVLGHLEVVDHVIGRQCPVFLGKELIVGRDAGACQFLFDDPTVSHKHLRIYSVVFDEEQDYTEDVVSPLVYAEDLSTNSTYWNGAFIGKNVNAVLLSDGDELRVSPRVTIRFRTTVMHLPEYKPIVQAMEMTQFRDVYRVTDRKIGAGGYGEVFMALHLHYRKQLACKIVNLLAVKIEVSKRLRQIGKARDRSGDSDSIKEVLREWSRKKTLSLVEAEAGKILREVEILRTTSHPNIVRLEKVYQSDNTLYIFEELITGGDLLSYVRHKGGHLKEVEAGVIVRQVAEALNYLHDKNIVHRDLKPDNILIASHSESARVVLTDFGTAIDISDKAEKQIRRMNTSTGTVEYAAPEIFARGQFSMVKGYTKAVDLWSLGCVTTALLIGTTPFTIADSAQLRRQTTTLIMEIAARGNLDGLKGTSEWQSLGSRPKDFVLKLLVLDEKSRMTAKEALSHKWFTHPSVKQEYDAVYRRAIRNWQPQVTIGEIVEKLKNSTSTFVSPRNKRVKNFKPIEPPYLPFHRCMNNLIMPRNYTPLPTITETVEELACNPTHAAPVETSSPTPSHGGVGRKTIPISLKTPRKTVNSRLYWRSSSVDLTKEPLDTLLGMNEDMKARTTAADAELRSREDDVYRRVMDPSSQKRKLDSLKGNSNDLIPQATTLQPPEMSPSRHLLRRPSTPLLARRTPLRPKDKDLFDFPEDDIVPESPTPLVAGDSCFTPINRRQSMKVGGFPDSSFLTNGHDGPLKSKLDNSNVQDQNTIDHYLETEKAQELNDRALTMDDNDCEESTRKRRRTSSFKHKDADLHLEAGKETGFFRNARTYAESLEAIRAKIAEMSPSAVRSRKWSGDLSDSVRTAYEGGTD